DLGFEAERLGRLAVAAGLRGVVASGHELALLRETLGPEPWIVVPGVRAPGDPADDQARTTAVAPAVGGGATHLVVGRPITRDAATRSWTGATSWRARAMSDAKRSSSGSESSGGNGCWPSCGVRRNPAPCVNLRARL